jgi:hypothetical protein
VAQFTLIRWRIYIRNRKFSEMPYRKLLYLNLLTEFQKEHFQNLDRAGKTPPEAVASQPIRPVSLTVDGSPSEHGVKGQA